MVSWVPILASIVGVTEAAVLPIAGGLTVGWDGKDTIGIQEGAATAEAIVATAALYEIQAEKYAWEEVQGALIVVGAVVGLVQSLEYLNGFGALDRGGEFTAGAAVFSTDITDILINADRDPNKWHGDAADSYASGNTKLQASVAKVAEADQRLAGILARQANQVEQGRQGLAGARLAGIGGLVVLGTLLAAYLAYMNSGQFELADSVASIMEIFKEVTALTVGLTALGLIITLIVEGEQNHKHIRSARRDYVLAIDNAPVPSGMAVVAAPAALDSVVPDFSDLAGADVPIGGLTRDPLPLRDQLSQASKQASAVSKEAAPYMYMLNQTEEQAQQLSAQVRQLATQTQQTPPAHAKTVDDVTLANATDTEDPDNNGTHDAETTVDDGAAPADEDRLTGPAPTQTTLAEPDANLPDSGPLLGSTALLL